MTEYVTTNIRLPKDVYREIKRSCAGRGKEPGARSSVSPWWNTSLLRRTNWVAGGS